MTTVDSKEDQVIRKLSSRYRKSTREAKMHMIQSAVKNLAGTVNYYTRHILLCSGTDSWPSNPYIGDLLAAKLLQRTNLASTRLTHTNMDSAAGGGVDMVLFPERIRLHGVTEKKFDVLGEYLRGVGELGDLGIAMSRAEGLWLGVCTHGERDCRCGEHGGRMYGLLKQRLAGEGVTLFRTAHIGGHQYAANVIAFPQGDWYGMLREESEINTLLHHLTSNTVEPWWKHWRGRMGLSPEEQKALLPATVTSNDTSEVLKQIHITFQLTDRTQKVSVLPGCTLLEAAKSADIPLEAVCGGNCECATCQVFVAPEWRSQLPAPTEQEEDMLEYAPGRRESSRLCCQIQLTPEMDGLEVVIPA